MIVNERKVKLHVCLDVASDVFATVVFARL